MRFMILAAQSRDWAYFAQQRRSGLPHKENPGSLDAPSGEVQ
jgi:hypothetical protein